MLYPEFPLVQQARLVHNQAHVSEVWQPAGGAGGAGWMAFESSSDEILMLARNESSLVRSVQSLRDALNEKLKLLPPQIRYMRVGNMLYEPNMHMRVSVDSRYIDRVRRDFQLRNFKVIEDYKTADGFMLQAETPLRLILGYEKSLEMLSEHSSVYLSWLHSYTPYFDVTI
jgi:hypothetical protein